MLSEDATRSNAAESSLRQAEEGPIFSHPLAQIEVASDDDVTPVMRWLASVCGNNAAPRSWQRHTRKNSVTDDERQFVTHFLSNTLGEQHSTIAIQISLWITVIARIDFPRHLSTAILDLCRQIRNSQALDSRHALLTFDMCLKQLATRHLISDGMVLYRFAPDAFVLLFVLLSSKVDQLIAVTANQPESVSDSFKVIAKCLKSRRLIISHGCSNLSDLKSLIPLFVQIETHPELFLRSSTGGNDIQIRLCLLVAKLVHITLEGHPISFQPYLAGFLRVYYNTILSYDPRASDDQTWEHMTSFITKCYHSPDYGTTTGAQKSSYLDQISA